MLWLCSSDVAFILGCCKATAYEIIRQLKEEMKVQGYFVNPNAKIPLKYFCERYGLDCEATAELLTKGKTAHANDCVSC